MEFYSVYFKNRLASNRVAGMLGRLVLCTVYIRLKWSWRKTDITFRVSDFHQATAFVTTNDAKQQIVFEERAKRIFVFRALKEAWNSNVAGWNKWKKKSGTRCRSSHFHLSIISAGNCLIKWSLWKVFPHASAILYANANNRNGKSKSKIANRVQNNHGFYSYNKMLLIGDAYDKIDFDFRRICVREKNKVCAENDLYDGMPFDLFEGAEIRFLCWHKVHQSVSGCWPKLPAGYRLLYLF